jgi:hypothetical protein
MALHRHRLRFPFERFIHKRALAERIELHLFDRQICETYNRFSVNGFLKEKHCWVPEASASGGICGWSGRQSRQQYSPG